MSDCEVSSYGKVWAYDDGAIFDQFVGCDVEIEEKVDGSQFSVMLDGGVLRMRSKNQEVFSGSGGMFAKAVESAERMRDAGLLTDGWTHRFEYLSKRRHNTLCYDEVPQGHLVLLDAESPVGRYLNGRGLDRLAAFLRVSRTPTLYYGALPARERIEQLLGTESFLGGTLVEGVVIKCRNYRSGQDGKMLKAKVVSAAFKERHSREWKRDNPNRTDIVAQLADELRTEARFRKVVEAARDAGELVGEARDIGPLMKRLGVDLNDEHREHVAAALVKHFWPQVQRKANRGFAEWYKRYLADRNIAREGAL